MVLRQLSGSPREKIKLIEESVERAKEAVHLDITDGTSWRKSLFCLGVNLFKPNGSNLCKGYSLLNLFFLYQCYIYSFASHTNLECKQNI